MGLCQDDRWTINENNERILVYTRMWRCNSKHNTALGFQKTVILTEIDEDNQETRAEVLLSFSKTLC